MLVETRRPTRGIEWAAGLLEGEGSMTVNRRRLYPRPYFQVNSTDRSTVEHLTAILGGQYSGPYTDSRTDSPRKMYYKWTVSARADVLRVARLVGPLMGYRRINDWGWKIALSYFLTSQA